MEKYDVIIIGGGPAGSTTGTMLAKKGHKVLLLEKEKFPREHIGESLIPSSYASLKNLGVLDELKKIAPRKPGVNFIDIDGERQSLWCFKNVVKDDSYLSFHVKRSLFDEMLLNNSRKNNVVVMEETMVQNMVLENEKGEVEVEAVNKAGERQTFHAKFLVDASGQSTFLGSKLGVKKPIAELDRVALWSHWSKSDFDIPLKQGVIKLVYLGGDKKGWIWVIPISHDNLSIGVVVENSFIKQEKAKFQKDASSDWKTEIYLQEIAASPAVSKLLSNASQNHKVQISGDYSYMCQQKFGKTFAMVGDSGAFLDPIFSSGIFVGMRSAEILADAVDKKFKAGDEKAVEQAFVKINGAVNVLEKFIRLFYTKELVNFADMGDPSQMVQFEQTENVYSLFHYLLAGDFFEDHAKYSDFLDEMHNLKTIDKFRNLIHYSKDATSKVNCGEDYEKMYGEVNSSITFDHAAFM